MADHCLAHTVLPVRPLPAPLTGWLTLPGFMRAWCASVSQVRRLIQQTQPAVVVAMGGFVAGPALVAGSKANLPVALVNLDTPPGRANRWLAKRANQVFSVDPTLPGEPISPPLRQSATSCVDQAQARSVLGLDPNREMLLITGGSQGARTINQMMVRLMATDALRRALGSWQVLHLVGPENPPQPVQAAYAQAGVTARVEPFCDQMGLAWAGATVAISRAGAGSVAEAWASATPTVFLPYPYHADQHQKNNVAPLLRIQGAQMYEDRIDPQANVQQITKPLLGLIGNATQRNQMIQAMRDRRPSNGAVPIAAWVMQLV